MSKDIEAPSPPPPTQNPFTDTLSVAGAAIASDPNFIAALATAMTSLIGGSHHQKENGNGSSNVDNKTSSNSQQ